MKEKKAISSSDRGRKKKQREIMSRGEMWTRERTLGRGALLAGRVFECGQAGEDAAEHEDDGDEEPLCLSVQRGEKWYSLTGSAVI
jgi:hypothetical protein